MDWDDLKYFVELARTGTLTAAARRLGVQHSTVSRRIARLEHQQGGPLFVRSLDGYQLNRAGEALLIKAEDIAAAFARLSPDAEDRSADLTGVVRIGCTEGFGTHLIGPRLRRLVEIHPGLAIDLLVKPRAVLLPRNEADIVINIDRPGRGPYVLTRLLDYHLGLFASTGYLARRPAPQRVADLHDHDFVSYVAEMEPAKDLPTAESIPQTRPPQLRSTSLVTQKEAVLAGCGIALLPHYVAANEPDLHPVLPEQVVFRKSYYMSMAESARSIPRILAVWNFLKETFRCSPA